MIPKIIHFCWLSGDPYPEKIQKCINSWNNQLKGYEIKLWDAHSIDLEKNEWTRNAYLEKRYAFVADYIRFYALYHFGGIYLDSDVEVLRSFDDLLDKSYFFGYEYEGLPEAAVIGAEPKLPWIEKCMQWYENNNYYKKGDKKTLIVAPLVMQWGFESTMQFSLLDKNKIENIDNGSIYPYDYFSAKNSFNGKVLETKNTYSIHHFNGGWTKKSFLFRIKMFVHLFLIVILGKNNYNKILYKIRKKKLSK